MQQTTAPSATETKPTGHDPRAWHRAFRDLSREHTFEPLHVVGTLPAELRGTLYRNGPMLFGRFGTRYGHWFDGDGGISAVRLAGGRAEGAVRLVREPGFLDEQRARRLLYGNYGTRGPLLSSFGRGKNVANTSVMLWQQRLLALNEGRKPVEISRHDLATIGETDLDGVIPSTFSAHPHRIPSRRAAYNFGVRYGKDTFLDVFELPDVGRARRLCAVPLAGPSMLHDFVATERYLVFFAPPLRLDLFRQVARLAPYSENLRWKPEEGTEVIVVDLRDPSRPTKFRAEPFYQWHFANAFERGGELVVDFVHYADFTTNTWLAGLTHGEPGSEAQGHLTRAVIDADRTRLTLERRFGASVEFPKVAQSVESRAHRYVHLGAHSSRDAARAGLPDQLATVDLETGRAVRIELGASRFPSEPLFVPRPGATGERDGWLLTLVYDGRVDQSYLGVIDAARAEDGVIAEAWFDHAIPFSFHGVFAGS